MLYATQDINNVVPVTASRNNLNGGNVYLWSVTHKLSFQSWRYIPYRILPSTTYAPGYDEFCFDIDLNVPQVLTGATGCSSGDTITNVHLIPGEYFVKIYAQTSNSNLNPNLADEVVWEGLMTITGEFNDTTPVTYSGTSDIFIIYNANNA